MRLSFKFLLLASVMCLGPTALWAQEAGQAAGVNDPIGGLLRGNLEADAGGANANANPDVAPVQAPDVLEPLDPDAPIVAQAGEYNAETAANVNADGLIPADDGPEIVGAINNRPLGIPPVQRRLRRPPDEDAYAPMGVKAGGFIIRPTLDVGAGYNTNAAGNAGGDGAAFGRLNGDVAIESDWSRHAVNANVRGDYTYYKNSDDNQLNLNGDVRGRLDISATTNAHFGLRAGVTSERAADPNLPAGVVDRPRVANLGGTVGGTWKPNRLGVTLETNIDRQTYEDAKLAGGVRQDNSDRNYNEYALRLQTGYDVSDKFTPFVELGVNTRRHDEKLDRSGLERSSAGASLAVGARYNLTDLIELNGSVGYRVQRYDDAALSNLSGLMANGSLVWQPSALTTVTLNTATAFEETTLIGSSGSVSNTFGVNVEHRLRRNVILNAGAAYEHARFQGIDRNDDTLRLEGGAEWLLNRSLALRANVAHEQLFSSIAGEDYTATLFQVGMRFRR